VETFNPRMTNFFAHFDATVESIYTKETLMCWFQEFERYMSMKQVISNGSKKKHTSQFPTSFEPMLPMNSVRSHFPRFVESGNSSSISATTKSDGKENDFLENNSHVLTSSSVGLNNNTVGCERQVIGDICRKQKRQAPQSDCSMRGPTKKVKTPKKMTETDADFDPNYLIDHNFSFANFVIGMLKLYLLKYEFCE